MLIPLNKIIEKYHPKFKGVIQVGAHWAEEHQEYIAAGVERFVYIEPCKEAFEKLHWLFTGHENIRLINAACGEYLGKMEMNVSNDNQGQSNSLLKPALHLTQHPEVRFTEKEVVDMITLDWLWLDAKNYNFLVMDVQGYEGHVLRGAKETLKHIDYVYTEVNNGETYEGNDLIETIDELLKDFQRVETEWPSPSWTWGDAFYIRKSLIYHKQNFLS